MSGAWSAIVLSRQDPQWLTLEELAHAARLHPDLVESLVDFGLLEPARRDGRRLFFDTAAVLRVRAIQRLRHDLGVNLQGVAIILDLIERLRVLQQELDWWRSRP
jgi:MerR family transcriptional regulator, heat shock protein HspR